MPSLPWRQTAPDTLKLVLELAPATALPPTR